MTILRRRKVILVFLVLVWIGGMAYFLTNLSTKDETAESSQTELEARNDEEILFREKQEYRNARENREEKEESQVKKNLKCLNGKSF